ncbi:MFS transporter [Herbiconiux sp. L3-i23]|uniref:MFS transporter n=1 Tax=Herbiconiux sp. L3-i23 TaxID=2905871 RepID=UPI0020521386|nr:MFS transporter [Herbiconiux sp. L3-i23]BDI23014.1 MFS transporter [Herbiconiux sp. L3-i23]
MTSTSRTEIPSLAGAREWTALAVVTLAVVLLAIDGTVLALAVPSLTAALDPTATQILWIGDIYSFALAGLLVTMGNVADRFGRKRLLLIGAAGFGIASVIAAFAPTPELLIAARVLLGVSGATLMPSTLSIIRNLFSDSRQRTRAIAVWSAGATGGAAVGPLVGGALLEHFWWGSVFLINVPVVVVLLIAGGLVIPESKNPARPRIDLFSAALSMLAIVPVVYAIKTVASDGVTVAAVVALVVGVASGVFFVRRQRRLAEPLIDIRLFSNPAFSGAVVANTMAIFAFIGMLFFFSQYLQLVRGLSPLQAGLTELPATIASLLVIAIVGMLVSRLGRGPTIAAGLAVAALGMGLLAVGEAMPGLVWLIAALVVIGFGSGVAMTVSTDAVMSAVPPQRAGAASAISETGYELGVALGIAVLGSIQTATYRAGLNLPSDFDADASARVSESLASADRFLAGGGAAAEAVLAQAQEAFTSGMQIAAIIAAVLTAIAAVVAWRVIPAGRDRVAVDH